MSNTVLITGFSEGVSVDDISQHFSKVGTIDEVTFLEGDNRALMRYSQASEAAAAVEQLSGRPLKGSTLVVQLYIEKPVSSQKTEQSDSSQVTEKTDSFPKTSKEDSSAKVVSELFDLIKALPLNSKTDLITLVDKLKAEDSAFSQHPLGQLTMSQLPLSQHPLGKGLQGLGPIGKEPVGVDVKPKQPLQPFLPSLVQSASVAQSTHKDPVTYLRVDIPHLPWFSGDKESKGNVPYGQWRYEVSCLKGDSSGSESMILQAIRKSCKGLAQTFLHSLGLNITIDKVLQKFDDTFGNVLTTEDLLQEFYSARQKESESVVEWECRLEDINHQVKQKQGMADLEATGMLRHQLWGGLYSSYIKSGTRHLFDSGANYSQLVRAARSLEDEETRNQNKSTKKPVQQHSAVVEGGNDKLDLILKEIAGLKLKIHNLEHGQAIPEPEKRRCYHCGSEKHLRNKCPDLPEKDKKKGWKKPSWENPSKEKQQKKND